MRSREALRPAVIRMLVPLRRKTPTPNRKVGRRLLLRLARPIR